VAATLRERIITGDLGAMSWIRIEEVAHDLDVSPIPTGSP